MAAVLKKRVIAELTQVIQEEAAPPPVKKLRLIHKGKVREPQLELHRATTPQDAVQVLLKFEEHLPIPVDFVDQIVQVLLDRYYKDQDAALRAKIVSLIGELIKTPGYTATVLLSDLKSMLASEKSHKVISQLIGILTVVGKTMPQDTKLHRQLLEIVQKHLKDSEHTVRVKCLELIGALGAPDPTSVEGDDQPEPSLNLESVMQHYTNDSDPRVRTAAFQAMLLWHERGIKLEQSVYSKLVEALKDDYEGVRLTAMKLIWVLSHLYPESLVPVPDSEESLRLIDDGFAQICHMVNDECMKVRAEAAGLLGSLHQVSQRFLDQTLDKKLMSDMRRKKSAHERSREQFESGEWSSGNKFADDRPRETLEADDVNVISSGACGALVHGLEDEFLEVRNAAIDSLCELANQSASFANKSQDYLVDMFNDEIEAVRLNAINSVRKICHHFTLREDQLDLVLSVLKDFNPEIRDALREMFCHTKFGTKSSLHDCVLALLDNLKRYPQDRASIWRGTQNLGINHPFLTLPLVPALLSAHPYFDSPEPDMDDPAYISILILVFNAAKNAPTMPQLFPEHIFRHYAYLRDTLPDLVPQLKLPGVVVRDMTKTKEQSAAVCSFMNQTLQRLTNMERLSTSHVQELMNLAIRDLSRVGEVDSSLSANAECMALYLQCQLCLAKLMSSQSAMSVSSPGTDVDSPATTSLLTRVFHYCHQMEHLFLGLSLSDMAEVEMIHLRAHTLRLLHRLQTSASEKKLLCAQFLLLLNHLQKHLSNNCLPADSFTNSLLAQIHRLESCDPNVYLTVLQSSLANHRPAVLKLNSQVRQAKATIVEHTGPSEAEKTFTAGLTTAVHLVAKLENIEETQNIRIQETRSLPRRAGYGSPIINSNVRYPDQELTWLVPRTGDFRQQSPLHHRLSSNVLLTHGAWSEPGTVEISVVFCYDPESNLYGSENDRAVRTEASQSNVLELCKPIKVQIGPKPAKR